VVQLAKSSIAHRGQVTTIALLRTGVDIATEGQNQQLLEDLTRGQAMQLRLQATMEGLEHDAAHTHAPRGHGANRQIGR
jgi:uncharacterized membrane-anchored protein